MRWTRLTLVITEAFVALSAFVAGAMFVVEPSGRLMGMTARPRWRGRRSGATWCPGSCCSPWSAARRRWRRGRRCGAGPAPGWLSVVAGVVLAGWITVQVAMIGLGHPMQPSLFVAGVVIAGLGWRGAQMAI
jgi:hypothetical protein